MAYQELYDETPGAHSDWVLTTFAAASVLVAVVLAALVVAGVW